MDAEDLAGYSPKCIRFLLALDTLCKAQQVCLSVSGYDALQVWDMDPVRGDTLSSAGIDDRTG